MKTLIRHLVHKTLRARLLTPVLSHGSDVIWDYTILWELWLGELTPVTSKQGLSTSAVPSHVCIYVFGADTW